MKTLLLTTFLLLSTAAFAQKEKTVYLSAEGTELSKKQKSEAAFYEVRQMDRKKRFNGTVSRYNLDDVLIEQTEYKKGVKSGAYMSFNPAISVKVYGEFENGEKSGAWAGLSTQGEESLIFIEYYEKGKLIEKVDPAIGEGNKIMVVVETPPRFPGGPQGWGGFLKSNMRYPAAALKKREQGAVQIKFLVLKNGRVVAPRVVKTASTLLTNEALRIINQSPNWIPATIKGEPVDSFMEVQIVFALR